MLLDEIHQIAECLGRNSGLSEFGTSAVTLLTEECAENVTYVFLFSAILYLVAGIDAKSVDYLRFNAGILYSALRRRMAK
jgi:hypothetical protein